MSLYLVLFSENAEIDFDKIVLHYKNINEQVAKKFIESKEQQLIVITTFPFGFAVKYKEFRAKIITGFPYSIVYDIDEAQNIIYINRIYPHKKDQELDFLA